MISSRHRSLGYRLSLVFALVFALIAALVYYNRFSGIDAAVIGWVQGGEQPLLTAVAKGLSLVGSAKIAIPLSLTIMIVLFVLLKHRMELLFFLWVGLGSRALNELLKNLFKRERPNIYRIVEEPGFSFPSGHSMAAFALYGAAAYLLWSHMPNRTGRVILAAAAVMFTAAIGWSRIYLGVHYPSDVIGGYAASCAWLMLSVGLFETYRRRASRGSS